MLSFSLRSVNIIDMKAIGMVLICSLWLASAAVAESASVPLVTTLDTKQPDWRGLRNDTYSFMGYQLLVMGILYVGPEDLSGWTDEQRKHYSSDKYRENIRDLVWDQDKDYVNYILHPYWGGTYFVRGRERGLTPAGAFWYSAWLSTLFEYGAEAFFEQPSIQDMIVTPAMGSVVGHYFMRLRAPLLARRQAGKTLTSWQKSQLFLTDPLGGMNDWVLSWMRPGVQAQWLPYMVNTPHTNDRPQQLGLSLVVYW